MVPLAVVQSTHPGRHIGSIDGLSSWVLTPGVAGAVIDKLGLQTVLLLSVPLDGAPASAEHFLSTSARRQI